MQGFMLGESSHGQAVHLISGQLVDEKEGFMHDTVNPFIETMGTAINRQEAAMPHRPEGTGLPGRNPVKHPPVLFVFSC
jgi:hypothetical protein